MSWLGRVALILAALALLLFTAGFLFKAQTTTSESVFARLTAYSNVYAFGLAAASTIAGMVTLAARREGQTPRTRSSDESAQLDRATQDLASVAHQYWNEEAKIRGILQPQPINVRWSSTRRPVAGHPADVLDDETWRGRRSRLRLSGDLDEIVALFRGLPRRQLIVLGAPGAGKTVLTLLLTCGLLNDPKPGEPLPVLLSLSSWRPDNDGEHLHTWVARRLVEDYPFLSDASAYGPDAATSLVANCRVMPVLDGLDELPTELLAAAIAGIDRSTAGSGAASPLVLTCRTDEYEEAIAATGRILSTAAVIEIDRVEPSAAAAYLAQGAPQVVDRWRRVLGELRTRPDGPLGLALTTPLMTFLARTIYTHAANDPAELLDAGRFSTREAIEQRLLSEFIPAIYNNPSPSPYIPTTAMPVAQYEPNRARRWLTFLADHLTQTNSRDLSWWRLIEAVPRAARIVLSAMAFTAFFAPTSAVVVAIACGLIQGTSVGIAAGIVFGVIGAIPAGVGYGLGAELVGVPGPSRSEVRFHLRTPNPMSLGAGAVGFGVVGVAINGIPLGLIFGLAGIFVVVAWELLESPADVQKFHDPSSAFGEDIQVVLVRAVVFWTGVAAIGLAVSNLREAAVAGFGIGATGGFISGLGTKAWGRFTVARAWLVTTRRLPFAVTTFLEDAHKRGALRRVGATYQFRHASVQNYLSRRP